MTATLSVLNLGRRDYWPTYILQKELVKQRRASIIPDTLILVEHPPVFTIGRRGNKDNILVAPEVLEREGIKVYEVDRGGDVTYHGPGQLVGYPILDLNQHDRDLPRTVRLYEEAIINLLAKYGINAGREKGYTGVWVAGAKVAAIGVNVKNWITYHGFALNLNPNWRHFQMIVPCGLPGKPVTSLSRLLKRPMDFDTVARDAAHNFATVWGLTPEWNHEKEVVADHAG